MKTRPSKLCESQIFTLYSPPCPRPPFFHSNPSLEGPSVRIQAFFHINKLRKSTVLGHGGHGHGGHGHGGCGHGGRGHGGL